MEFKFNRIVPVGVSFTIEADDLRDAIDLMEQQCEVLAKEQIAIEIFEDVMTVAHSPQETS